MIRPPLRPGIDILIADGYSVQFQRDLPGLAVGAWAAGPASEGWSIFSVILLIYVFCLLDTWFLRGYVVYERIHHPCFLVVAELATIFSSITIPRSPAPDTTFSLPSTFQGQG
jgi:hypothetical protein